MPKTVLITGASSGIGKATAEVFAAKGWNVIATSRSADKKLFSGHKNIYVYKLDVTDKANIDTCFDKITVKFGAVDVVVNNAGYGLDGIFEEINDQQIRQQFDTNVFGLMDVTRKAIQVMKPAKSGKIIQVSSMAGLVTFPLYSIYHSSKWAVEGFSESLHYELKPFGIQLKLIEPGVIKTEFYGQSRRTGKANNGLGYKAFKNKVETSSLKAGSNGASPSKVARVILKAALSDSSKLRYAVGYPAPILLFLRRVLPDQIFFKLIRTNYKI